MVLRHQRERERARERRRQKKERAEREMGGGSTRRLEKGNALLAVKVTVGKVWHDEAGQEHRVRLEMVYR